MVVLALAVMVNFLDRGILALLIQPIKKDLQLTDMQLSLIMGFAFTFFYAVLGLPVARLIDRGTRKYIFSVGLSIFAVMTLFCGLANNFWHLFLARMGLGVGRRPAALRLILCSPIISRRTRLARAISVMQVGFVAGSAGALLLGGWLVATVGQTSHVIPVIGEIRGWQAVLMLISIPGFIVAALMLTVKEPPRRGVKAKDAPISEVFRLITANKWVYFPLFAGMGMRSAQMFGSQGWNAALFERSFGWGPAQYSLVGGMSILVSMPIGLFLGNLLTEHFVKKAITTPICARSSMPPCSRCRSASSIR